MRAKRLGSLYGVSVGTGDPELITIKGQRLLQETSIIAFPMGVNGKQGLAEKIITPWITPQQKKLPLYFPYLQDEQQLKQAWKDATETVWEYLYQGLDVAFACEGDISLYSTFTYLAQTLREDHPQVTIQTIPGVCSPVATASVLGIPLTLGSQKLAIIPALYNMAELDQLLSWADVIVLLKVSSVYSQVWHRLERLNLLDHAFIVERANQPEEKIYRNLRDHPTLDLSYFSLMIITGHC
ncbi:precorrin-2 C20-methyltransferase [Crocosphaera subtropica ATCC 51142]|uniref:Precorrin-2 C20-methyltransferase n=1 Tax=Crocosphaera subtropica (strain ATCC 51142 / BH68) TaxID=43989 RepID=B1WPA7_CROS5|nr:precorrin-2 C(20)-methyltransferase [Crocosphaera subtropica]ACB49889.1 precorrin-2 C20-methyltransferase [Crocosphaera subtropica ATCC 51142]